MQNLSIKLGAKLTFATVEKERSRIFKALHNNNKINIDLVDVSVCDSAGLALLIDINRNCFNLKKQFQLDNIPQNINALAKFCGIEKLLNS